MRFSMSPRIPPTPHTHFSRFSDMFPEWHEAWDKLQDLDRSELLAHRRLR